MPTLNKLNDAQCRSAKPTDNARKLFDGGGLFLFVSTTGAKTWRLAYRLDGKPKTISFGPYPDVSLAQAREERHRVKADLRGGIDPMGKRRAATNRDTSISLGKAAELYWGQRKDVSDSYRKNAVRAIERYLVPSLGKKPLGQVTKADLLQALNVIDAAGRHVYVRKVRVWISHVFEWGVEQGYAQSNPALQIRPDKAFGISKTRHQAALEARDIPDFLARLSFEKDLNSVIACKLLALTWVRTNELRRMTWDQIEGDIWRLPPSAMKSDEYHLVPLSRQACVLIETMRRRCRGSRYVFPNEADQHKPMSENSVLYLIYRIGYKGRMTGHGWRAVASTWANEQGFNIDAIERQLAHAPRDKTRAAYNRAAYLSERKRLMQCWADWLDACAPKSE